LLVLYERMHILPPSSMFSSCSFQCNATWWRHMLCTALTLTLHYRYHYHHYHHEMSATWLMCVYIIYISIYLNMCSVYSSLPSLVYSCRLLIFLFYHVVFVDIQNSLFRLLSSSKCFFLFKDSLTSIRLVMICTLFIFMHVLRYFRLYFKIKSIE